MITKDTTKIKQNPIHTEQSPTQDKRNCKGSKAYKRPYQKNSIADYGIWSSNLDDEDMEKIQVKRCISITCITWQKVINFLDCKYLSLKLLLLSTVFVTFTKLGSRAIAATVNKVTYIQSVPISSSHNSKAQLAWFQTG